MIIAIVEKKITNVELDNNTILEKDLFDDKVGILDIRAKIDNNINCNIEMQVVEYSTKWQIRKENFNINILKN